MEESTDLVLQSPMLPQQPMQPGIRRIGFDSTIDELEKALEVAKQICGSNLVPKEFRNNPSDCLVAMQLGVEVGFSPMQALQTICVINGRPTIWGDGAKALVVASGLSEFIK